MTGTRLRLKYTYSKDTPMGIPTWFRSCAGYKSLICCLTPRQQPEKGKDPPLPKQEEKFHNYPLSFPLAQTEDKERENQVVMQGAPPLSQNYIDLEDAKVWPSLD